MVTLSFGFRSPAIFFPLPEMTSRPGILHICATWRVVQNSAMNYSKLEEKQIKEIPPRSEHTSTKSFAFRPPPQPPGAFFLSPPPSFLSSSLPQNKCWKTASLQSMESAGERPFMGVTLIVQLLQYLFAPIAYDTCPNAEPIHKRA